MTTIGQSRQTQGNTPASRSSLWSYLQSLQPCWVTVPGIRTWTSLGRHFSTKNSSDLSPIHAASPQNAGPIALTQLLKLQSSNCLEQSQPQHREKSSQKQHNIWSSSNTNHFCLQFISQNQSHCLSVKVPSQLVKGWQTLMRSVNGISMTALSQTQILRSPSLPHASCIPSAPREPVLALMLFTKDCQFSTNQTSLGALS